MDRDGTFAQVDGEGVAAGAAAADVEPGAAGLVRIVRGGAACVGSAEGPVRFGFTERTGGVSQSPYASLNLGTHVEDDPAAVAENRRRALALLGAEDLQGNLLVPNQVHGDRVVLAESAEPDALAAVRADIAQGADAVVCTAPGVPVLLCFADCVPVVLVAGDAFAVAHSGWKGTYTRIAGKTARALAEASGADPASIHAYIGPHILGDEYEVSEELIERFEASFGPCCTTSPNPRMLDLSACIAQALEEVGVPAGNIHDTQLSTVKLADRFYSYRRERGACGRHGALAVMLP